jgi:1-acyl-sn-glycerol-3-phosphate acyltransferase
MSKPLKANPVTETLADDAEWPLAFARLKNTEPHPDQGIACVGTRDLEMALERVQQFAHVALGNAIEISRLTAELVERIKADIKQCGPCGGTGQVSTTVTVGLRYRKRSVECPTCARDRELLNTLIQGGGQ